MTTPTRPVLFALLLALVLAVAVAVVRAGQASAPSGVLRIASWNMEWLVDPRTARDARIACRERRRAALPCDVARAQARDSADLRALAALVRRLDADVIAFQEVENTAIARRVFRGYEVCVAPGTGVQHVGFAFRRGLDAQCGAPLDALAAGGRGRPGLPLTLRRDRSPPVELLAVHLKSGCSRDALDSGSPSCTLLAAQARALGEWIAPRAASQASFIVLGDLNRAGAPGTNDLFWELLDPSAFEAAATYLPFRNCVFGAPYEAFIDHILVGHALLPRLHGDGFEQLRFAPAEAANFRLPDHCPVSISLSGFDAL